MTETTDRIRDEKQAIDEGLTSEAGGTEQEAVDVSEFVNPKGYPTGIEAMRVSRDLETGNLEPIKLKTLWEGHVIEVIPLTYRDRNRYRLDERGLIQLDDDERLEFLREHMVSPSFEEVESLDEFGWTTIDDILTTVSIFSRDNRRRNLPRPMRNGGKGEA